MENSAEMQAGPFIIKRPSSTDDDAVTTVEILLKTGDVGVKPLLDFFSSMFARNIISFTNQFS